MLTERSEEEIKILEEFAGEFGVEVQRVMATLMEAVSEKHFDGNMPVDFYLKMMDAAAIILTELTLKEILLISALDPSGLAFGKAHIETMEITFDERGKNIEEIRENFLALLTPNTTQRSVH